MRTQWRQARDSAHGDNLGSRVSVSPSTPRKYEYSPAPVHVQSGAKNQLTIAATDRNQSAVVRFCQSFVEVVSLDVISYLKLSGSRLSSRPSAVSACGYMRKPTGAPFDPGRATSCAKL